MENFQLIKIKLAAFVRKFYLNELLKGAILFFALGLLYFLLVLFLEHVLWLDIIGRNILFWLFLLVEIGLLVKFIFVPLSKLLKLSKGIQEYEASKIIGEHFPEVSDKLLNILQLRENKQESDLLIAGIEQKSRALQPVPFASAVDFKTNIQYLKYAAFPIIIVLAVLFSGNFTLFADSYIRVINYNTPYEPPEPFSFIIENENLRVEEDSEFTLRIKTIGNLIPETVSIHYNDNTYYLKSLEPGVFEYEFNQLKEDIDFKLFSNEVTSNKYNIEVIKVPKLVKTRLFLDYPRYTGKQDDSITGTGNITVPEGTKVHWNFYTQSTSSVQIASRDSIYELQKDDNKFIHSERLISSFEYQVSTSNASVKNHEKLNYRIEVIKDEYPQIEVEQKLDSIDNETRYFYGKVSDDYSLSKLQLVYFVENDRENSETEGIFIGSEGFDEFHYTFPGSLELKKGTNYHFYFRVFDNDAINGAKSSNSKIFSFRKKSEDEIKEGKLEEQGKSIESLSKSLENMKLSDVELEEIARLQKESQNLNYNDRKKLDDFLKRQKQETEMMKKYSDKLKRSFDDRQEELERSDYEKELKERMERNEKRLEENEQLLKQLEEYSEKIKWEGLGEKLEELSRKNQSEQRNLEQLLELTKRYYIEEKAQKLSRDLEKLANRQEGLTKDENNNAEMQNELSDEFEEFKMNMEELEEENEKLKSPMELGREEIEEESIQRDQQDAEKNLEQKEVNEAKKKQQDAAKKMRQMSKKMQEMRAEQSGEQLDANIEGLRQILDNLVIFSFQQEDALALFKTTNDSSPLFAEGLRNQSNLREHFKHIDDSLYSLALKNPMINEEIMENLTNIAYDLEKALERLAEGEIRQGTASQQYIITGANNLAYLLSDILSNMQDQANMKPGKGEQKGDEFQLPDIIRDQEKLQQQMQKGMDKERGKQKGEEGKEKGRQYGEEEKGELFEIYKEQQKLRQKLEDILEREGIKNDAQNLRNAMEQLEEDLLNKGFNPENIKMMENLKHELLKFDEAILQQGEDEERSSKTNNSEYQNPAQDRNLKAKEYFNSTEILNRQALPLQQIYKQKVKLYFEGRDD